MHNRLIYFAIFCSCLLLVACNQSSMPETEEENIEPNYVNYRGEQGETNQEITGDSRFRIPVNPGREQNIFENNQYDGNFDYGNPNQTTTEQNEQRQQDSLRPGNQQRNQNEQNSQNDQQQGQNMTEHSPGQDTNINGGQGQIDQVKRQVINLTNEARQANGASPVQLDTELASVAQKKSEDMAQNNYFSHTSPTYGSPFDMLRTFGVDYTKASENIAAGQRSAEEVVQGWLNSEGHRKNMLDPAVTHIGVGYDSDGNYWTQMFISK
ncbi:CAP domain-containing protein [Gracilibacillus xinjiangensis]|uniref:CAP domain-containing protein n=1 Tax=Gracilibacillus xinjiangensis TaxID=1193282 RepID=A0ABV8WRZ9_9BACI